MSSKKLIKKQKEKLERSLESLKDGLAGSSDNMIYVLAMCALREAERRNLLTPIMIEVSSWKDKKN